MPAAVAEFETLVPTWKETHPQPYFNPVVHWCHTFKHVARCEGKVWLSGDVDVETWGRCRISFSAEYSRVDKFEGEKEMCKHAVTFYAHVAPQSFTDDVHFDELCPQYERNPMYQLGWDSEGTNGYIVPCVTSGRCEARLDALPTNCEYCWDAAAEEFIENYEAILSGALAKLIPSTLKFVALVDGGAHDEDEDDEDEDDEDEAGAEDGAGGDE